jgi:4-amino-4-deoxy-L-arabinose transferase-like glycosyltransferase
VWALLTDSARSRSRYLYHLTIVLLWVAVYLPGTFSPPLFDDADAAHADAGREIVTRQDWVTLHENGIRYLEKAPLPYWLMATSFKLFGVHTWSARLPQALSVLALLILLVKMGEAFLSFEAGFWAAVVFATSFGPYLFTRILIPDVFVGFWIGLTLYFFLKGYLAETPSRFHCWGLAVAVALNVLTKSLIGLVFPGAIVFLFLLAARNLRHLRKMRLVSSTIVFLIIAVPWHALAALRNPAQGQSKGFLWFYFMNEQFLRYLGKRYPVDYGTVPLFLFWGLVLVWLMPWIAFLPQALRGVRLRLDSVNLAAKGRQAALLLFALWAVLILVFFSFSTRQEYYAAPALPGLALLLGAWLANEADSEAAGIRVNSGRISSAVLLGVGLLIACVTLLVVIFSHPAPPGAGLADLLNKNPDAYVLSLGHFLDLSGSAMSLFRWPLIGTGLAFFLGTVLNWLFRRRGKPKLGNFALSLMLCAFIECAHVALTVFEPVLGSKALATAIQSNFQQGDAIVCDGEYANASSVNFYTQKQLLILNGRINGLWYGSLFPDAPPIFLDDAAFEILWKSSQRVFFVAQSEERKPFLEKLGTTVEVARAGGKFVFTNRSLN